MMEVAAMQEMLGFLSETVVTLSMFVAAFVYILVSILKKNYSLEKNVIPVIAVGVGVLAGVLAFVFTDAILVERVWAGLIGGMLSIGVEELFSKREGFTKEG